MDSDRVLLRRNAVVHLRCLSSTERTTDKLRRDLAQLMREGSPMSCFADIEVINRAKEQSGGERPEGATSLVLYDVRFLKVRPTSKTKPGACNGFDKIKSIPILFPSGSVPSMALPARMEVFIDFILPFTVFSKMK